MSDRYMHGQTTLLAAAFLIALCCGSFTAPAAAGQMVDDCGYPLVQVPSGCTGCHGAPPQKGAHGWHPANPRCHRCHGAVIDSSFNFISPNLHNNGTVDHAVGCSSCHGWNQGVSPPQNLKGECGKGLDGAGSHKAMRMSSVPAHQVACANCHIVPLSTWAAGHIDGDGKAEVVFSGLAKARGVQPSWTGTGCKNVYCHGATLTGGDLKEPAWKDASGAASKCGACHGLTCQANAAAAGCSTCHPATVGPDGAILPFGAHINGVIDTAATGAGP